jgi:hypothetical protein
LRQAEFVQGNLDISKQRQKRVKKDKLELYETLQKDIKEQAKVIEKKGYLEKQEERDLFASGDLVYAEGPIAPWQAFEKEKLIIERALEDGYIDSEEAANINKQTLLSIAERGRLMKQLFERYEGDFQYDNKTGRIKSSVNVPSANKLKQQVSRSNSRGSQHSNREWPDPRAKSSKPNTPRDRGDHRSNYGDDADNQSNRSSSRATTPDHFEDDDGRHDDLRKQIRGIGNRIKNEWDQHRAMVEATEKDKEAHLPKGATSERNQYKLLITPRNRNFLSQLGLKPEIAKNLPTSRNGIDKLYKKLDRVGVGFVPTSRLYEHFRTTGMKISESDAQRLVQLCDTNSDGYVEKSDLTNALQKLQPMIGTDMCKPSQIARAQSMVSITFCHI